MGKGLPHAYLLAALVVSGCAGGPPHRALHNPEEELKTGGTTAMLFHSVLYYPSEISLNFPGFIVGIEKSPTDDVSTDEDAGRVRDLKDFGLSAAEARDEILDDPKALYVSHIVESKGRNFGLGNCALYNAYVRFGDRETLRLIEPCEGLGFQGVSPKAAFSRSWDALEVLANTVRDRIEDRTESDEPDFTHIVVATMGWNTVQEEAVRNFNSIIKSIRKSSGDAFNPLFIGVTWPSQWESGWIGPLYRLFSFGTKANDADELGLSWLGVLLHDTLPKAGSDLPVVVIGHSFGARAASVAACVGPAIYNDAPIERQTRKRLSLINLQGAFQVDRLLGEEEGDIRFRDHCNNIGKIYLTASINDKAMNNLVSGDYAGSRSSYDDHCGDESTINCVKARSSGCIDGVVDNGSHITYINADDLIYQNAYLSGGGAHSDVYRDEHGELMWRLISGKSTGCDGAFNQLPR